MSKEFVQPTDEQVRVRAYCLWETEGKPQGRDWEYWLKAKEQLEREFNVSSAAPAPRKTNTATTSAPTENKKRSRTPAYA